MKNENKIKRLEILDKVFVVISIIIGIITVIDIFVPDPIFLLDEAALASLTGLFTYLSSVVRREIENLKENKKTKINTKDIGEITNKITDTASTVKKSRKKK